MDINDIELTVQTQTKLVSDECVRPKLLEYNALNALAEKWLAQRAEGDGSAPEEQPLEMQFGQVTGSMLAGRPQIEEVDADELELYASENEDPMPMERWSTVKPTSSYRPVHFEPTNAIEPMPSTSKQADLRQALEQRRPAQCGALQVARNKQSRGDGPMNQQCANETAPSERSHASYVSTKQEKFMAPVTGRAYPPFRRELPIALSRQDPNIIGISEIFVHPAQADAHICPICPISRHKLYRCPTMLRAGLRERWFLALRAGVCLNCMIREHSSFTCMNVGACVKCCCRHNSILCPKNPNNMRVCCQLTNADGSSKVVKKQN